MINVSLFYIKFLSRKMKISNDKFIATDSILYLQHASTDMCKYVQLCIFLICNY